jgi:hypothetical protein
VKCSRTAGLTTNSMQSVHRRFIRFIRCVVASMISSVNMPYTPAMGYLVVLWITLPLRLSVRGI